MPRIDGALCQTPAEPQDQEGEALLRPAEGKFRCFDLARTRLLWSRRRRRKLVVHRGSADTAPFRWSVRNLTISVQVHDHPYAVAVMRWMPHTAGSSPAGSARS